MPGTDDVAGDGNRSGKGGGDGPGDAPAPDGGGRPLLEVEDVYAGYDGSEVLHGVDLRADRGEIVAVVGPNGAGKSTTFRTIFGLLTPTSGTVRFDGEVINGLDPPELLGRGLCYVPQGRSTFPELTVEKNLRMSGYLKEDVEADLERVYDRFPDLREKRSAKAKTLSGGQQQMLEMGGGLIMDPDLLLLDEPSLGLAPKVTEGVFDRIHTLIEEEEMSFLIIEQNARRALRAADRGYVIDRGEVALSGPADELLADGDVQRLYLGGVPEGEGEDGVGGGSGTDADSDPDNDDDPDTASDADAGAEPEADTDD